MSVARRHLELSEQRRGSVPDGVNAHLADAVVVTDTGEGADEVARLDQATSTDREDQSEVRPGSDEVRTVSTWTVDTGHGTNRRPRPHRANPLPDDLRAVLTKINNASRVRTN